MRNKPRKYQTGGDDSTGFFNQVASMYAQQLDQQNQDMPDATEEPAAPEADPYAGYDSDYEDLSQKYSDLQDQFTQLSDQFQNQNFGQNDFGNDQFLNFLFKDDDNNMPMDFGSPAEAAGSSAPRAQGTVNPYVKQTEKDILSSFPAKSMGIWGDEAHQARKSDHNTGDAEDFGFDKPGTGQAIAANLQAEAKQRGVKYIIYNHKIWNPDISNDWRPYSGPNPHTDHVHVSYKRQTGGYAATPEEQQTGLNDPSYWSMFFPMHGQNLFRGLDNGQPVHLQDETGKQTVLYGPDHTTKMTGAVQETRGSKYQVGGELNIDSTLNANRNLPFVDRIINANKYPVRKNPDGSVSTHLMAWATDDQSAFAYPTLRLANGKWVESKDPHTALNAGDYIRFPQPEQADYFTQHYKDSKLSKIKH